MDRNLGASQVATSSNDAASYGDIYQWGRASDGHEKRTSSTTDVLSDSDTPGHGYFITSTNDPYDWRSSQNDNLWQGVDGVNNPCPTGYRIPTNDNGAVELENYSGFYWSSTVFGVGARSLFFNNNYSYISNDGRAEGNSVRCIKND